MPLLILIVFALVHNGPKEMPPLVRLWAVLFGIWGLLLMGHFIIGDSFIYWMRRE